MTRRAMIELEDVLSWDELPAAAGIRRMMATERRAKKAYDRSRSMQQRHAPRVSRDSDDE